MRNSGALGGGCGVWFSLALALAFLPLAVSAENAMNITIDENITHSCLDMQAGTNPQECIGLAANQCQQTPNGSSNAGMGFCYGAERDFWDKRLNKAYEILQGLHQLQQDEAKLGGYKLPDSGAALRDMQRAWIAFRDASCEYEGSTWGGGSITGPAMSACSMRLTALQALELERRVTEMKR